MQNDIKTLRIQNFKSIKDVTMTPRRVNLIIGPPNVGKSNILEAMSLLGSIVYEQTEKFMGSFIRYEEPRQLFYDNLVSSTISVETEKDLCIIGKSSDDKLGYVFMDKDIFEKVIFEKYKKPYQKNFRNSIKNKIIRDIYGFIKENQNMSSSRINALYTDIDIRGGFSAGDKKISTGHYDEDDVIIRSYVFAKNAQIMKEHFDDYLYPSTGDNLAQIIRVNHILRREISKMFDVYGLKLLLRVDERRLEVVKDLEGIIYSYPYSSIADTLQRIIFYLAAIESNKDSVILFEEPEAHSYPQYVSMLGKRIAQSRNNQFFVATHSPYLLTEILEQMLPDEEQARELAIFVAYYEDYQTKVKQLSDEEVRAIRGDSVDVFYNMARYIPRPANG
ncbi:AAA family ATPase [Hymenobacter sp. J193]|uniref:AAA family ATPase n=1 Tax=Hymenobacter sp. J193 TaxID=2898429 RepID=UPI00215133C2|nr:AAA family ATPase [Hymenobacter sp. J193]MCR5890203.1 AAA family ATPase [Hymenobacter sp. J193]